MESRFSEKIKRTKVIAWSNQIVRGARNLDALYIEACLSIRIDSFEEVLESLFKQKKKPYFKFNDSVNVFLNPNGNPSDDHKGWKFLDEHFAEILSSYEEMKQKERIYLYVFGSYYDILSLMSKYDKELN